MSFSGRMGRQATWATMALLLVSCQRPDNPFTGRYTMHQPSAEADLLLTSNAYNPVPGQPHEVYALDLDRSQLERLTFTNALEQRQDALAVAPGLDRPRVAVLKTVTGPAGDPPPIPALFLLDLSRNVEKQLSDPGQAVSGADWLRYFDQIFFSAVATGGRDDLFSRDLLVADSANSNFTQSPDVSERHPRVGPLGDRLVYEQSDSSAKTSIWIWFSNGRKLALTAGGAGQAVTPTGYVVGSDADPALSPDGTSVAFRRLMAPTSDGSGRWQIMTVDIDATRLAGLTDDSAYRGAPDWGNPGIVFVEGQSGPSLVLIARDGSNRRTLLRPSPAVELRSPRFLP